jgi:hypothetical protein
VTPRLKLPRGVPRSAPAAVAILLGVALLIFSSRSPVHAPAGQPPAPRAEPAIAVARPTLPSPHFCDGCDAGGLPADAECGRDADCRLGLRCHGGLCLEGGRTCDDDGACPVDGRCAAGRCLLGVRDCVGDADCPGLRCALGHCQARVDGGPDARPCHNDLPCRDGRCAGGVCVPGVRVCLDDRDCPAELACSDGLCARR